MTQRNHYEYYAARAEACLQMARRSARPAIAAIHRDMAKMYETTAAELEGDLVCERPATIRLALLADRL